MVSTLENLSIGQKAIILSIKTDNKALKRRIMDMGLFKGALVEVINVAPLGDPVGLKVRGFVVSIRREHLKLITGEILPKQEQELIK